MIRPVRTTSAKAFTLIELMVAVALLSLVIVGVSLAFKSTITAVNTANAATNTFSSAQTVEQQIASDLHGLDRNGFLVIRQQWVAAQNNANAQYVGGAPYKEGDHVWQNFGGTIQQFIALHDNPGAPILGGNADWAVSYDHADQLVFVSRGQFANWAGAFTATPTMTFADHTTADAAVVSYGHLTLDRVNESNASAAPSFPTGSFQRPNQLNERDLEFGRMTFLMLPNAASLNYNTGGTLIGFNNLLPATTATDPVTTWVVPPYNARFGIVWQTPSELMQWDQDQVNTVGGRTVPAGEAYETATFAGYRQRVLDLSQSEPSAFAGDANLARGAIRVQPVMMPGLSNFRVEWTYGPPNQLPTTHPAYNPGSAIPVWYGYAEADSNAAGPSGVVNTSGVAIEPTAVTGDLYTAQFSYDSSNGGVSLWPRALRITYRVVDPGGYLKGGRTVVQVVNLP